jgi:hypothetical protein
MVDLERQLRIEVAQRVVRQAGKMQHGVEAEEIRHLEFADVFAQARDVVDRTAALERATLVKVAVAAEHIVSGLEQRWR